MDMLFTANDMVLNFAAAGLSGLQTTLLNNWIKPVFIVAVAVFAVIFIKDRAWMKLIGFVGIAAIVGVLVFQGDAMFGKEGNLTKTAKDMAVQVN